MVDITRRWIKNFAELARPLTRLTGKKALWKWTQSEQLSFELLKTKSASRTRMHGLDLDDKVHFYTDASGFAAGLVITQFRKKASENAFAESERVFEEGFIRIIDKVKPVEVLIIYDSFPFSSIQRLYSTYKKKLCSLTKFVTKYDYLCKHSYLTTVIHTDHRPLTHFLGSDLHEGIYDH